MALLVGLPTVTFCQRPSTPLSHVKLSPNSDMFRESTIPLQCGTCQERAWAGLQRLYNAEANCAWHGLPESSNLLGQVLLLGRHWLAMPTLGAAAHGIYVDYRIAQLRHGMLPLPVVGTKLCFQSIKDLSALNL
eukprot:1427374-Amphidinium_carterae.1